MKKKPRKSPRRWLQYWHGLGRCPDPLSTTVIETAQMRGLPVRAGIPLECREYVYASTSRKVAAAFSVLSGGRAVCEVKPGALEAEPDTDFPTLGVRFHGPVKAATVQLLGDTELMSAREVIETLAVDYLWTDTSPQYTVDGFMRTPPRAREHGFGEDDFRWLGRWFPFQFLYSRPDGSEAVFDENGRTYMMFPPGHPELRGRRGVPLGSLDAAWHRPGFFPHNQDLLMSIGARFERGDPTLGSVVMPWDW